MSRSRPWRAAAVAGSVVLGRVAAVRRSGLRRFRRHWRALGVTVIEWEVLPEPSIDRAARASAEARS